MTPTTHFVAGTTGSLPTKPETRKQGPNFMQSVRLDGARSGPAAQAFGVLLNYYGSGAELLCFRCRFTMVEAENYYGYGGELP